LPVSVIYLGNPESAEEQPLAALGTTRDISAELTETQRAFKVVLALPLGYVIVWARLIWFKEPQAEHPELGYLVAAQITEMSAVGRALYGEYLQRLGL